MHQKQRELDTTTSRKAHRVAALYSRDHKAGKCPRCNSGRPCFLTSRERIGIRQGWVK